MTLQTHAPTNFAHAYGGPSVGCSMHRHGSEDPHQREQRSSPTSTNSFIGEFLFSLLLLLYSLCALYFSPRRGSPSVVIFCKSSYVTTNMRSPQQIKKNSCTMHLFGGQIGGGGFKNCLAYGVRKMFEGDFADTCTEQFQHMLMGTM